MSKELTEKLKNGDLEEDFYYVKNKACLGVEIDYYHVLHSGIKYWSGCEDEDIEEVLAPVPTYEEWEELQESNDGLSKLMFKSLMNRFVKADEERERLEKENAELTTKCNQLKEANEVIKNMKLCMGDKYDYDCVAEDVDIYLEKWGVK